MKELRIVFMGTPEFAVSSLEILVENKFNLVAVITAPDKPQGRGQILMPSPVKACALNHGIPVLQPNNLKSPDFLETLRSYQANLQVVVAFRMLPEVVWAMPKHGTFNLHASLLPQYRGAAPINWAIINGEKVTGVTTFFLQHEIDTGGIIFQEKEPIHDDDDVGSLYDRLKKKGSELVLRTVQAIANGNAQSIPQPELSGVQKAPKIFKETCEIHWTKTAAQIRNLIRGLSPYPSAWTVIKDKPYKIFKISLTDFQKDGKPGDLATDDKTYLYINASDGWVSVEELQAEGKKRMTIKTFFLGNRI